MNGLKLKNKSDTKKLDNKINSQKNDYQQEKKRVLTKEDIQNLIKQLSVGLKYLEDK